MKVFVNNVEHAIDIVQDCTLDDILEQIAPSMPQGHLIKSIVLNDKPLQSEWRTDASKIYVLEDDTILINIEDSTVLAKEALVLSREYLIDIMVSFMSVVDDFRAGHNSEANAQFSRIIENLQLYLKLIIEAASLMGRPMENIVDGDVYYSTHLTRLGNNLDTMLPEQQSENWLVFADMIENDLIPTLKEISRLYALLGVR